MQTQELVTGIVDMDTQLSLKRGFLYSLIGSVAVSALLGIGAILVGDFGETEIKILLTTLTISAASICGMSCGAALETGRVRALAVAGLGLSVLAALLIIGGVWGESGSEGYWKSTATSAVWAVAVSHISLLLLARLGPRFAWNAWAAPAAVIAVGLLVTIMLWGEIDDLPMFQLLGVTVILDAALTVLTPIFHRLSRGELESDDSAASLVEIDREISALEIRLERLRKRRQALQSSVAERSGGPTTGRIYPTA